MSWSVTFACIPRKGRGAFFEAHVKQVNYSHIPLHSSKFSLKKKKKKTLQPLFEKLS